MKNKHLKTVLKRIAAYTLYYSGIIYLINFLLDRIIRDRKKIVFLMYHAVEDDNLLIADNISFSNFSAQMQFLNDNYKVISLEDAISHLLGIKKVDGDIAVLTFDDAYSSVYRNALPVLRRFEMPSMIYVPAGYIGMEGAWKREERAHNGSVMSKDMINDLKNDRLVSLGSHGFRHLKMSELNKTEIYMELSSSKQVLENITGSKIKHFSYPYGQSSECSNEIAREVKRNGYATACSTIFGRYSRPGDLYAIRRIGVDHFDTIKDFKLKMNGGYDWLAILHAAKIGSRERKKRKL